jgi:hypothetical protein
VREREDFEMKQDAAVPARLHSRLSDPVFGVLHFRIVLTRRRLTSARMSVGGTVRDGSLRSMIAESEIERMSVDERLQAIEQLRDSVSGEMRDAIQPLHPEFADARQGSSEDAHSTAGAATASSAVSSSKPASASGKPLRQAAANRSAGDMPSS